MARSLRRAFFVFVSAVVLAGLFGVLGPTDGVVTATNGGFELEVEYPRTTRSGLAAGLTVTIRRAGGLESPVTLALRSDYFDNFDVNGVDPEPLGATSTADRELGLFQPPETGDEMTVSYDARVQPGVSLTKAKASVSLVQDGRDVVTVQFETLVLP